MPKANGPVEQCSCGAHYPLGGAALCADNNHRQPIKKIDARYRRESFLELTAEAFCAECSAPLAAEIKLEAHGRIVVNVLPHICEVDDPEEEP
jgi:hypothetical protein